MVRTRITVRKRCCGFSTDCQLEKKSRITSEDEEEEDKEEDRISGLPDHLIHKILRFLDMKLAVQTCVLSKRWKLIWTTLPFLSFEGYSSILPKKRQMFIRHVLSNRNHESGILMLSIYVSRKLPGSLLENFIEYAISHKVQVLDVSLRHQNCPYKLSTFNSKSLVELRLVMKLEDSDQSQSECWHLPSLTTLHLQRTDDDVNYKLCESWLICLFALKTLSLKHWDLRKSSFRFSLPILTSLHMYMCKLPETVWYFPALKSLDLYRVVFPENMRDIFPTLVSLQNLTLFFGWASIPDCLIISCPQLVNLDIGTEYSHLGNTGTNSHGHIVVLAPNLCNFTSFGIFSITFGVSELQTVNIKLRDWADSYSMRSGLEKLKECYKRFTFMLPGLGSAKILSLQLETIEALSTISDFLVSFPSPFPNLKYVKLPQGCKETIISSPIRRYLLGASPRATIVTSLPQNNIIS